MLDAIVATCRWLAPTSGEAKHSGPGTVTKIDAIGAARSTLCKNDLNRGSFPPELAPADLDIIWLIAL
jgi:hypothetical protein